ncbi:MAG: hypothetical protein V1647_06650, partial [Pseudomonadota bacterium]
LNTHTIMALPGYQKAANIIGIFDDCPGTDFDRESGDLLIPISKKIVVPFRYNYYGVFGTKSETLPCTWHRLVEDGGKVYYLSNSGDLESVTFCNPTYDNKW